ncbi:hypothetical protein [Treponema sp. OMZ 857]|uniref:hypothetical protein n=1 Tax=Treponema sp. OMZ 857 TaxID=1643513 RepID=UPI0020A4B12F|nr:hypothetical protein [Treponema sp. OMZ 857]UTC43070.1 hypothetical protein E4N66_02505 [Treponema sp. OMZ 857]
MILALSPSQEQVEIVNQIKKLLSKVKQLENKISQREEYTNQLMKSILKDTLKEDMSYGKTTAN